MGKLRAILHTTSFIYMIHNSLIWLPCDFWSILFSNFSEIQELDVMEQEGVAMGVNSGLAQHQTDLCQTSYSLSTLFFFQKHQQGKHLQ